MYDKAGDKPATNPALGGVTALPPPACAVAASTSNRTAKPVPNNLAKVRIVSEILAAAPTIWGRLHAGSTRLVP